jgi:gliding motility-associated-like protein
MLKRVLILASALFFVSISAKALSIKAKIGMGKVSANCTYTTFTFYDSSTYSVSNSTYNSNKWYFGDGTTATGATVTHSYSATGTYTVSLVASNSNDNLKDSTTRTVVINLVGAKAALAMVGRYCQRSEINATNNSVVPASPVTTQYFWDFGDGNKVNTKDPGVRVYTNTGTFIVTLKDSTSQKCVSSASQTITIKSTPQAKGTVSQHCEDSSALFDASNTVTNGNSVSYSWTFQDTFINNKLKTSRYYAVSKTYVVKLGVTNLTNGCNDTVALNFTVFSKPQVKFGYKPVCQDSIAMFFDSTYIAHGSARSWHWSFADSTLSNWGTPYDYTGDTPPDTVTHGFPHGGTFFVTLTVKSLQGCVDSGRQKVYINPTPIPDFYFKNTCQDSAIQFSDSSKVPAGNAITGWLWNFGDDSTSTLQNPKHKYAKPGYKYKVKLVAITKTGCRDSITKTLIAYPSPSSAYAFASKCAGDIITFSNNSSMTLDDLAHNDSITHYRWNFADGTVDSVVNPLHTFTNAGTYNVRLISYSTHGCTDTNKQNVLVYALPKPSFTVSGNCERDSVSFNNTSTATFGSLIDSSYIWDFGDTVTVQYKKNPKHLFKYAGTFKVKLTATTRQADGKTGCSKDTVISVVIIPGPHSSFSWFASCFNQPVIFNNATASNTKGTIKYKWDFGDGSGDTAKNPTHTYPTVKNFKVKLVSLMPATGCNDSLSQFISVAPIPKAYFKAANTCNDNSVIFTDSSILATNYYFKSFVYDFGDGTFGTGPNTTHKYANPGVYTVKEVVTSTTNCQDSFTRVIETYKIPTAKFGYSTTCAGIPTLFIDSTSVSDSVVRWKWTFSNIDSSIYTINDTSHNGSHIYHNSDILSSQLIVTSNHGCVNTKNLPVKIFLQPGPFFTPPTGCNNRPIPFYGFNNNKGSVNVSSYQWNFDDGKTSPDSITQHTFDSAGTFHVVLREVSNQGCIAADTQKVIVTQIGLPTLTYTTLNGECVNGLFFFFDTARQNICPTCLAHWDFGDGVSAYDPHPNHKYTTPGIYTVKLAEENASLCTSDTVIKNINVHALPSAKFVWDTACFLDPTRFFDSSYAGDAISIIKKYNWAFPHGVKDTINKNPFYTFPDTFLGPEDTFSVHLKVTSDFGCSSAVTELVYVKQRPRASFFANPNPVTIQHPQVTFRNNTLYADTNYYYWTFGDGFDSHLKNPTHSYNDTGTYLVTLAAMSNRGCADTFRSLLYVVPGYTIWAPNCMTINGDGVNDEWRARGVGVIDFDVIIVDRWGQVVFRSTDMNETWKGEYNNNGIKVPEGVYKYYIKAGNFANTDFTSLKGNITVLR